MSLLVTVPEEIVRAAEVAAQASGVSVEQTILQMLKEGFSINGATTNGSAPLSEADGYSTDEYTVIYPTEESEAVYWNALTPDQREAERASIARSLADIDAGRTRPAEEVHARIRAKYAYLKNGE